MDGPEALPLKILSDRSVAVLEAIVEYLRDKGMSYHEIATRLNRDDRTIWTAYNRAKKKHEKLHPSVRTKEKVPLEALKNREFSILESVVIFLKEQKSLSYAQIASGIARNDRTIWTVYNRALKKRSSAPR